MAKWMVGVLAIMLFACPVSGEEIPLDPGKPLKHYSSNRNDGYSSFRGIVFEAAEFGERGQDVDVGG